MINRILKIMDNAYFAKHKDQIEINITEPSYENAMAVEELKDNVISHATSYLAEELVKIKQNYPKDFTSTIEAEIDIVVLDGKEFNELKKLLNGFYEIWTKEEQKRLQKEKIETSHL